MKNFYGRNCLWMLALMACLAPCVLLGARAALATNNNNVKQWVPKDLEEAQRYRWFLSHFQGDEVAIVQWTGCTLDNPKVPEVAEAIRGIRNVDGTPTFAAVLSGPEVLEEMVSGASGLDEEVALERLKGILVGPDGLTTAVIARVRDPINADRERAVQQLRLVCTQVGLPPSDVRLGGPTVDSANVNAESKRSLVELAGLATIAALAVAWFCLRHWRLVAMVFAVAVFAELGALAIVWVSGTTMNSVLIMLPTLVYVTTLSGSIHLVNYYKDVVLTDGPDGAVEKTAVAGWLPCLLSSTTTAIGTGSLLVSRVVPVKHFGIFSAIGVLLSLACIFTFLLALLACRPLRREELGNHGKPSPRANWWRPLARFTLRRHTAVVVGGCLLLVTTAFGLPHLRTSVKLQHLFAANSPVLQNYRRLEAELGPLVPMEVVLRIDQNCSYDFMERLELVREVEQAIRALPEVGGSMSAASFVPDLPTGNSLREQMVRGTLEKAIPKFRAQFERADFMHEVGYEQLWRISGRVPALGPLDYGTFVARLQSVVDPTIKARHMPGIKAEYTGAIPLIYRAQRELLNDLISSFLSAFALIAVALMVSQRGVEAGLWAMLPNVFPIVVVFGALGGLGFMIDIGTMMTAGVGLGIAVDDTLHFLTWYRRNLEEGRSRLYAVMNSYKHCATAMLQTTLVVGLGLLPFAMSQFVPTARFAWLMASLLTIALLGDLILLPAMLAGPIGRFFGTPQRRSAPPAPVPAPVVPSPSRKKQGRKAARA